MNLEQKIDNSCPILDTTFAKCEVWTYEGVRFRLNSATQCISSYSYDYTLLHWIEEVNDLIIKASLEECLTSPSEYIREYRLKYERGESEPTPISIFGT